MKKVGVRFDPEYPVTQNPSMSSIDLAELIRAQIAEGMTGYGKVFADSFREFAEEGRKVNVRPPHLNEKQGFLLPFIHWRYFWTFPSKLLSNNMAATS